MKPDELLELVRAGFTKDEIFGLEQGTEPITDPDPVSDPVPDPVPDPSQDLASDPKTEPLPQVDVNAALAALTKQVENLTKAQQAANRSRSNLQTVTQSTDEILAGLINPPSKEK